MPLSAALKFRFISLRAMRGPCQFQCECVRRVDEFAVVHDLIGYAQSLRLGRIERSRGVIKFARFAGADELRQKIAAAEVAGESHFGEGGHETAAAAALGGMPPGDRAGAVIDKLTPLLGDRNDDVRIAAAETLGNTPPGDRARALIDRLTALGDDADDQVRSAAAQALAKLATSDRTGTVIDKLTPLLGDSKWTVVSVAAEALGNIPPGDRTGAVIDRLTTLLDETDPRVQAAAAQALGQLALGGRASGVTEKLLMLLDEPDGAVQSAAAEALGQITPKEHAADVVAKLLPRLTPFLLGDSQRRAVARALGQLASREGAGDGVNELLPLLSDHDSYLEQIVITAIAQIGPAGVSTSIAAIQLINSRADWDRDWLRAAAHVATGADAKKEGGELFLAWLGRPAALPLATVADNPAEAHKVLQLLTDNWAALSKEPRAREEAENAAMAAIEAACRTPAGTSSVAEFARASLAWLRDLPTEGPVHRCWTPEQKPTVEKLLADFKQSHSTHEKALEAHLKSEDLAPVGLWLTGSLVLWTLLWAAFLVAFPWSRTVQAIFFWNPRARQFFSAGFVPLLLLILPPLRRRLLAPFRDDLVAQARLEDRPMRADSYRGGTAAASGGRAGRSA